MEKRYIELYDMALKATENSYAPYSKFFVGAALLTKDGDIYTGVNIENSSYSATICAERSAVCSAVTDGHREFEAMAIASAGSEAWPCGICRQVLFEFNEDMKIISGKDRDHLEVYILKDLLVKGFKL